MKKLLFLFLFLIFGLLPLTSNATDGPVINSISPEILDSFNEVITIQGENLGSGSLRRLQCDWFRYSTYDWVNIDLISWTDNTIEFKFDDSGYFTPKIKYGCQVDWFDENSYNLFSNKAYVYIRPNITSLSSVGASVGSSVTLRGSFFGDDVGQVTINNKNAITSSWSWDNDEVVVTVPDTTSGNVILIDSEGISSNSVYINITVPECTSSSWSCDSWSDCTSNNIKTRTCSKTSNCEGGVNSPATTQSCTYIPACSTDTWECSGWGTCSPQGIQTRSCNKTYNCPSAETAAPATSQYCESSYQQNYQTPSADSDIVTNQDTIIKATVKLICPVSSTMASQGSGTVINSTGLILTNKHVIDGTSGCLVGFIDDYNDEPYFGDRQIADIYKISSDTDVAVLKLRNPSNATLASINISQSNSGSIKLGEILTTYGYPAKFGTKITYTSGDFSGVDGSYLKTTAIIEHGNSGGGAYLKNGTFIGIPTAVVKGSLNSMGYLLSVNKVNSWLNNSSLAYNSGSSNNYSRVSSILENIDLDTLGSLNLFIAEDDESNKTLNTNNNNQSASGSLQNRVKGYILLQVESHGEAWYVNPADGKRYYMKDGITAYEMMRKFGLGITNADLAKLPQENETNNYPSLVNRLKGKIILQVESVGEAWYVNPKTGYRHYMKDGAAAYNLMRYYSLGITNADLEKISVGEL